MTSDKKLGDLVDRLSILELRQFMAPRFRGHEVEDDTRAEIDTVVGMLDELDPDISAGPIAELRKLNARIWMLQHVEAEINNRFTDHSPRLEAQAVMAIGMIHKIVMNANTMRVEVVAKLNGEAVRKVY